MRVAFAVVGNLYVASARRFLPSLAGREVAIVHQGKVVELSSEILARGLSVGIRRDCLLSLCPEAAVIPFDPERGEALQRNLLDLYAAHVPAVEPVSLTETFLDVRGLSARPLAHVARQAREELGINVCFGRGATRLIARAAGLELLRKRAKGPPVSLSGNSDGPPGLVVSDEPPCLAVSDGTTFLAPLPPSYLYPLPEEVAVRLARHGFTTIGQVGELPLDELIRYFGRSLAHRIARAAAGGETEPVRSLWPEPSLCYSRRFNGGVVSRESLLRFTREAAERLAREMAAGGMACREPGVVFVDDDGKRAELTRRLSQPTRSSISLKHIFDALSGRLLASVKAPPAAVEARAGRIASLPAEQLTFGAFFPSPPGGTRKPGFPAGPVGSAGPVGTHRSTRREHLLAFYDPLRARLHVETH